MLKSVPPLVCGFHVDLFDKIEASSEAMLALHIKFVHVNLLLVMSWLALNSR